MSIILQQITARMAAEGITSLSDAEIERTLKDCVAGNKLIPMAKEAVANGLITFFMGSPQIKTNEN